jgi:hypothetical protein
LNSDALDRELSMAAASGVSSLARKYFGERRRRDAPLAELHRGLIPAL